MANQKMERCIMLMLTTDKTQKEIAEEINITEKTISTWKKTAEFVELRTEMNRLIFGELAVEATRKMRKLLNAKSELVQFNAAKDLLDRAGYAPVDKQEISAKVQPVFVDDIGSDLDDG